MQLILDQVRPSAFDNEAVSRRAARPLLSRRLYQLSVTPVPSRVLEDHKRAMVQANPPSWLYGRVEALFLVSLVIFVVSIVLFVVTSCNGFLFGVPAPLILVIAAEREVKGPARWKEQPVTLPRIGKEAPGEIAALCRRLKAEMPTVCFRLGVLVQDRVVLDPYVIATDGQSDACLGIWMDSDVIAVATQAGQ